MRNPLYFSGGSDFLSSSIENVINILFFWVLKFGEIPLRKLYIHF